VLALAVFSDRGLPVQALGAEEEFEPELTFVGIHHRVEVAASVGQQGYPSGKVLNARYPAVLDLFSGVLPSLPAEQAQELSVPSVVSDVGELTHHAAGNDNSRFAVDAAAPVEDICLPNIYAGKQVAGRAPELICDSIYPIRFDSAPIHCPSVGPNGAVR
jgi:hypothetical protein